VIVGARVIKIVVLTKVSLNWACGVRFGDIMSLSDDARSPSGSRDVLLSALANRYCRTVVRYFVDRSDDVASVTELSTALASEREQVDRNSVAIHLYHVALPKLAGAELVEYDIETKTVRYRDPFRFDGWQAAVLENEIIDTESE